MNKRQFLKGSSLMLAGNLLPRLAPATEQSSDLRTNWAGNVLYSTEHLEQPATPEAVQAAIRATPHLKALGTRHSFNEIADSTVCQISLKRLDRMDLDPAARTVTVGAGVTYGQLGPYLDSRGFALGNLASLPHISVVGACVTASHGSGTTNGNLATAVRAFEIVTANGETVSVSPLTLGDSFPGAVVSLGALGVITSLTLGVQPTYQMDQIVYENLPFDQLGRHLRDIFAGAYSVSIFTDWQHHRATQVWLKRRLDRPNSSPHPDPKFFGATLASAKLHPLAGHSPENCTDQGAIPGPWYERLPHFKMNFTPSSGAELQTEYFVPLDRGYEAILAVEQLRDHLKPHLMISEFRTVASDDQWISPCYRQACMTLHFTWKPEWAQVKKILPLIEAKLEPFRARPHWAKLFTLSPTVLRSRYEKMPLFLALLSRYDPQGKFRNEWLEKNLYRA